MEKSSFMFEETFSLFAERYPKLGLLAPSWESINTVLESPDPFEIGKSEAIYVYGLGGGDAYSQLKSWLKENGERKLIFLEDEPGLISSFLESKNAREILLDPQVFIELLEDLDALVEKYPIQRIEVVPLPSKKGARFRSIRLKLLRKTALAHALRTDRLHGYQPMENFFKNIRHLPHSFYANKLKGAFRNIPAIVCGAGPSLKEAIPILKELEEKALIIAGGSTLAALSSQGAFPHFGMAIDPNLEEYRRLKNSFAFEVPFLYSTRVFPSVFQTCNGPFGYMRSGIGGAAEIWMEEELNLLEPLIGETLSPESISVTAICVAWAQFLGCDPIFLSGVDLAYTGNKRYAEGVGEEDETHFSLLDAEKSAADRILKRKDRKGKWVHTAVRWIMESASLSHFAKTHKETRFFNTTEGGIGFKNIPFISLSDAREKYFKKSFDLKERVHAEIANAYMAPETKQIVEEKIKDLIESLNRVICHLEILAGKRKGSSPLAEIELKDELAMSILFYDAHLLLPKENKWEKFLELALKYKAISCCLPQG